MFTLMVSFFGVQLTHVSSKDIKRGAEHAIANKSLYKIATVNPEILLQAKSDTEFASTLNSFECKTTDGFGISLVARLLYGATLPRVTGTQVVHTLCELARETRVTVGVLGGKKGRSGAMAQRLRQNFPGLNVDDVLEGINPVVSKNGIPVSQIKEIQKKLSESSVQILFVAFGAPKQERFIEWTKPSMPSLRVAVGIGGLVDVFSGKIAPPPRFFSAFGLEWVWRIFQEPKRFTRILRAVIVFPLYALFARISV